MNNMLKIAQGVDVVPLLLALQQQPGLWNRNTVRRDRKGSPHAEMSDIWLRYNDETPFRESGDYSGFANSHESVFYPAWYTLPQVRPIVMGLMARVEGVRLGGVMITKIPPGGAILPHADKGWHAEYYNTKLYVVLQSNPYCVNKVENDNVAMAPGEVWHFDNLKEHAVVNNGADDRITLIICVRCEK
jgi:hypothetical protein